MAQDVLNEREFELVNIIGAQMGSNQRDLSNRMNLSLGMINMLIRRLISKGYIRIRQLNKRKVEYILTPKGFTEKTRKSVKYTIKTLHSIGLIKNGLKETIMELYQEGERNFFVLGKSDLAHLVEIVFREMHLHDYKIEYMQEIPSHKLEGTILICKEDVKDDEFNVDNRVDLIKELAEKSELVIQNNI